MLSKRKYGLLSSFCCVCCPSNYSGAARKENNEIMHYSVEKVLGSKKHVFTPEQEEELVNYLKDMEARLFGLTMTECRSLTFQLAEQNRIEHPFNKDHKMAGMGWMQGFFNRHRNLSIRKPEARSGARAMGFNKMAVQQLFKLLEETVQKYQLTAEKIYNVDETGITVNPKGNSKIIASKEKGKVGTLTSAERGETVTVEICFSASGAYMPPMLIFPRKRMQQGFLDGLIPGGWVELNEKEWIDKDLFFHGLKSLWNIQELQTIHRFCYCLIQKMKESAAECLYCRDFYSTSTEGWISCTICHCK